MALVWRHARLRRLVYVPPAVLYHDRQVVHTELRRHRLREEDLLAAARRAGNASMHDVHTILLEGNGTFTVITGDAIGGGSTLGPVPTGG